MKIAIDQIIPDPNQPRKTFEKETIKELASSLESYGVISPLEVRPFGDNQYMIIVGELRYRATKERGNKEIECVVREATDQQAREMQFIENYHRQDIPPKEQWRAWSTYMKQYGVSTAAKFSYLTGIPESTVRQGLSTLVNINIVQKERLLTERPTIAREIARIGTYEKVDKHGKGETLFIPDTKRQEEVAKPFLEGKVASQHAAKISRIAREEPRRSVYDIIDEVVHKLPAKPEPIKLEPSPIKLTGDSLILMMDYQRLLNNLARIRPHIDNIPKKAKEALGLKGIEVINTIQDFNNTLSSDQQALELKSGGR